MQPHHSLVVDHHVTFKGTRGQFCEACVVMNMNQDLKVEDAVLLDSGCRGLTTVLPSISNSSGV